MVTEPSPASSMPRCRLPDADADPYADSDEDPQPDSDEDPHADSDENAYADADPHALTSHGPDRESKVALRGARRERTRRSRVDAEREPRRGEERPAARWLLHAVVFVTGAVT